MADPKPITSAVVQVGKHGGRGFIVAVGEHRYVVTAAHCVFDKLPIPHPARDSNEVTYKNLIGPLGGKRSVSAECMFLDAIADIAVFGTVDAQDRGKEALAYEELTGEVAFKIGKMPPRQLRRRGATRFGNLPPSTVMGPSSSEARMLSLQCEWFTCKVMSNGGSLWFDQAAEPVVGGMSGSPIVLPDGSAVGVVCTSEEGGGGREGGPNPMLTAHLPGWLLEEA
jgi:Trypsin-like peptidase domain